MSETMIPYPFMNIVERAEVGCVRYGEIKNDGLYDWMQRAERLFNETRGMTEAEKDRKIEQFTDACDKSFMRGKFTQGEYDQIMAIISKA